MFIKDHEKLNELSPEIIELKNTINNKNYENSISIIDNLFEKLGEISGTEELANKLDDLISIIDNEEIFYNSILINGFREDNHPSLHCPPDQNLGWSFT